MTPANKTERNARLFIGTIAVLSVSWVAFLVWMIYTLVTWLVAQ